MKIASEEKMNVNDLEQYIGQHIQGVFSGAEIRAFREELSKLKAGDVYLEVGVDEGKSFSVAFHYSKPGVYVVGIDIADIVPHEVSKGRGPFMEKEGMIGKDRRGFFIHGDANVFMKMMKDHLKPFINILFIDGAHGYEDVRCDAEDYIPLVVDGGVIFYHDYDHIGVKKWTDEYHGDEKEVINGKIVRVRK